MNEAKIMKGSNTLILCMAEMKVALQEYIDARLGGHAPQVAHIKLFNTADWTFAVELTDRRETKEAV
jgi:hypothetical protein